MILKRHLARASIAAICVLVLGYSAFLYLGVEYFLLSDSGRYFGHTEALLNSNLTLSDIQTSLRSNYLGMSVLTAFVSVFSGYEQHAIIFLNTLFLVLILNKSRLILNHLGIERCKFLEFLILINPVFLLLIGTINKEVPSMLIALYFVHLELKHSRLYKYIPVLLAALLVRDALFITGVIYLTFNRISCIKKSYLYFILLVVFTILARYFMYSKNMSTYAAPDDNSVVGLSAGINFLYENYLYAVAIIPKIIAQFLANLPIKGLDIYDGNIVGVMYSVSSVLFLILIFILLKNGVIRNLRDSNTKIVSYILIYSFVVSMVPFIHQRYIFPLYPLIIVMMIALPHRNKITYGS